MLNIHTYFGPLLASCHTTFASVGRCEVLIIRRLREALKKFQITTYRRRRRPVGICDEACPFNGSKYESTVGTLCEWLTIPPLQSVGKTRFEFKCTWAPGRFQLFFSLAGYRKRIYSISNLRHVRISSSVCWREFADLHD